MQNTYSQGAKRRGVRQNIYLNAEVLDRLKNVAFWTPTHSLSELVEEAIVGLLNEKEKDGPYAPREKALKRGRPIRF